MKEYQSLSHTRWDCKYHVVFIPKQRKKRIFGALRHHLGAIFHELAGHKGASIVEGHLMSDHVHMCISIAPKYAVSNVVGYIKGKSAIQIARQFGGRQRHFTGEHFWARGYFVAPCTHRPSNHPSEVWMRLWYGLISVTKNTKMCATIR